MLTLLVACDPGIWPAIVTQGPEGIMLAMQVFQGAGFLPSELRGEALGRAAVKGGDLGLCTCLIFR